MPILQLELEALAIQNIIIYKNYGYGIWAQVEQGSCGIGLRVHFEAICCVMLCWKVKTSFSV